MCSRAPLQVLIKTKWGFATPSEAHDRTKVRLVRRHQILLTLDHQEAPPIGGDAVTTARFHQDALDQSHCVSGPFKSFQIKGHRQKCAGPGKDQRAESGWRLGPPWPGGEKKACLGSQAVLPMRPGFVRVFQSRLQAEGEEYARHTPCLGYSGVSPTVTTITAGSVESDSHADPVLPGDSGPGSSAGGEG